MLLDNQNNSTPTKNLSLIIPVYNEEQGLKAFHQELEEILSQNNFSHETIFVNDGSIDLSGNIIEDLCKNNSQVQGIHFSRNFGHEAAMIAGIDHANGEAIICMDADLQHPPQKIPEMYEMYKSGYEVINMIRNKNDGQGFIHSILSGLFYRFINTISPVKLLPNASDFFLISHRVAGVLKNDFRERNRFLRGFIQIIGFRNGSLRYNAEKRKFGKSKYSFLKLIRLSFNAIASFSNLPLRLGIGAGVIFALFSVILGIYSIVMRIIGSPPSGYTTLVVLVSFAFSIQFFLIGFIGMYVGYNFDETKKRPIYIIDKTSKSKQQDVFKE